MEVGPISGEDGWIWRFRGTSDGGIEAIVLENRGDRVISGILSEGA